MQSSKQPSLRWRRNKIKRVQGHPPGFLVRTISECVGGRRDRMRLKENARKKKKVLFSITQPKREFRCNGTRHPLSYYEAALFRPAVWIILCSFRWIAFFVMNWSGGRIVLTLFHMSLELGRNIQFHCVMSTTAAHPRATQNSSTLLCSSWFYF